MYRRAGIFVFYDKDGIVDEYIIYLLEKIKKFLDLLIIVSNGRLVSVNSERLEKYADFYFERENKGFDFGAWKEILTERFPLFFWHQYDELLFFNDTYYGPVTDFDNMFTVMERKKVDMWGITRFGYTMEGKCLYPPFIQTYFGAVKKSLFQKKEFFQFWNMVDRRTTNFNEVQKYEKRMSKYFLELGYKVGTYIDTTDFEFSTKEIRSGSKFNFSVDKVELSELLKRGFPFIKRKNFFFPINRITEYALGEDLELALLYVREHSEYDMGMIFQNILRLRNNNEVARGLHLNYIFEKDNLIECVDLKKVLLIVYIEGGTEKEFIEFFNNIKYIQVVFFSDSLKNKKRVAKIIQDKTSKWG